MVRKRHKTEDGRWKTIAYTLQSSIFLLFTFIALCASPLFGQEVGLSASSDRKELRTGEPVWVNVGARVPAEIDSIGPVAADSTGMFQILSVTKGEEPHSWKFELMTIDTGKVFVAPLAFLYTMRGDTVPRKAYANSLAFNVTGIKVAPDADIKDIKAPVNAPWMWEDIWPYLLGLCVFGGAAYWYWRYRKKRLLQEMTEPVEAPHVEPHVIALRELRMLEEKKLWQQGQVKEYYSEATEIVRRFFEGRWRIAALEMTTPEILTAFAGKAEIDGLKETMRAFFTTADMVKFAKAQPTPADHARELEEAYTIVRGMTPAPPQEQEKAKKTPEVADVR